MQFNKVNIPKLARNRYDYVAQGSGGNTTIVSGGSGGTDSASRLIEPIYSDTGEICGIRALYSVAVQGGITTYREGEGINLPSIYDGMPIDNITLYWDDGVLKSKGTDGMDEGKLKTYLDTNAYINNANKANYLPSWALATNKPAYTWTEISNKPAWIGSDKPAYAWSEIGNKPTWIGDNKPSYTFSEIGGKPTTLSGYGITDAVTLNTSQTITAAKNFTGGLSVNGGVIVYDTVNKAWKLTGNLLVTGGITAYGDILTGSAILDALPVDSTLSKEGGLLSVVGGGGGISGISFTGTGNAITNASTSADGKSLIFDRGKTFAELTSNVASATKLVTPRSINGTNFDGTDNIVTSYWGTARNFSIVSSNGSGASSAVSVNGSGSVSLYLPSTITASLSGNATTATTLQNARTIWGQSFRGDGNVSGHLTLGLSQILMGTGNYPVFGSSNVNTDINAATGSIVFGWRNTLDTIFYANSSDSDSNVNRKEVMRITKGYRVGIGTSNPAYTLDVNGNSRITNTLLVEQNFTTYSRVYSTLQNSYAVNWQTFFSESNAIFGVNVNALVYDNQMRNILTWKDIINGQGFITSYSIGSYRSAYNWGKMILAVSNADATNSVGAAINIGGDGKVVIEGDLLVTGGITQYATTQQVIDVLNVNTLKANDCLLVGSSSIKDAPERMICCYKNASIMYINLGNNPSAANTAELSFNYVGNGSGNNYIGLGFYGGTRYGMLQLYASGANFLHGSLTTSGTITPGSDMRRKTMIRSITSLTTDQIANAPLFDYYWKDINDGAHTGTSAQYWQNVLPNTVRDNGKSGLSLDYNGVTIAGLITVSREIVKLKRENEELRQEINKLKERAA